MDQRRDKGTYNDEIEVRDLSLQDTSTIRERKAIIDRSEAHPREQQMGNRGYNQQKSDRNKEVLIGESGLYLH